MNYYELKQAYGFYENELVNHFLAFWLPRCIDEKNGGFVNCFDNRGEKLISTDKYVWSQGRFVWIFSKLAALEAPLFSKAQRAQFLALAKHGADFLMEHCLIGKDDWRCVYLLNEAGNPRYVDGYDRLDMSIYADCLVVLGLSRYAVASGERAAYDFAKRLYESVLDRIRSNTFETLPSPLSREFRAHGIPMLADNASADMFLAAQQFEPDYSESVRKNLRVFSHDVLEHFADDQDRIHEVITKDNQFFSKLLGSHINPGHTVEDAWFLMDSLVLTGDEDRMEQVYRIVKKTLKLGWDEAYGGLLRYASLTGGAPAGDNTGLEAEPMSQQLAGWGDKLWWVHSEALYTTLRCYLQTGDEDFLGWYRRLFAYIYRTFPNEDPEIREWIQIRTREGKPEEKVVALPVKDPYHVIRNLCLILELLHRKLTADAESD